MILFLSASFLRRLHLIWKPDLKSFLIGSRNLFFFTPDSLWEVQQVNPETINRFLQEGTTAGDWELLGFLAPGELPVIPGYLQVNTAGSCDPNEWMAYLYLLGSDGPEQKTLEIRTGRANESCS